MTVSEVWAAVDGTTAAPIAHEGDVWTFPMPAGRSGHITVEVWAEDEAGNQSYKAAIVYLEGGTVKRIVWRTEGGICTMLKIQRPTVGMMERPVCSMKIHECRRTDYAAVL